MKYSAFLFLLVMWAVLAVSPVRAQEYIVGEGDVLKITVYEHADLTTTARVGGGGTIGFPLIGQVEVGGLSTTRISEKIVKLLGDGYIVDPHVSIFIEEYRSKRATILGQVNKPGLYELRGQTTILQLISEAGGLTKDAGARASLKRKPKDEKGDAGEKVILLDLKALVEGGDTGLNIPIEDGDSVFVGKMEVFYVTGQVKKPDAYKYDGETTVIKSITMAGGFTDKAAPSNVRILRKVDGREEVMTKVKMDQLVLPEDVIVVPESFF